MALYTASKTRRSLIDSVTFRVLSQIATVVGYIVLVRGMSKSDFGLYALLYSFIPVFGTVASFGLEPILRRYQPEYLRQGNVPAAVSLVRFIASTRFLLNIVLISILLLAWNTLAPIFHMGPYRAQFIQFAVLLILHFQSQILILSLASHMLHRFSVGSTAFLAAAKMAGYLLLQHYGSFSLTHAIMVDTVAYALVFVIMRVFYHRLCAPKGLPRYKMPPEERKRMVKYGFYNNFNDAGVLLLSGSTDYLFIAAFIDPVSVGIYAFYGRLSGMAINVLPVRLFDNIIQPLFFSIHRAEAHRRVSQLFTFLLDLNIVLLWPMLMFAVVYHTELVNLVFAGKYVEHGWLLPLFIVFSLLNSIAVPVTLVAQYEEKPQIVLFSKIFVLYNIASMFVLLPLLGIYGALLSRGSAEVFKNLFIWWWVRDKAHWHNVKAVLLTAIPLWGAIALLCYEFRNLLHTPPIVNVAFGIAMCAVGLLIYVRTPAIAASDRQLLANVFQGREAGVLRRLGLLGSARPATPGA